MGQESVHRPPNRVPFTRGQAELLLGHWLGSPVRCLGVEELRGGICSTVYRLRFNRPPGAAVVKLQGDVEDDPLPRERARLDYLRSQTELPVPEVYAQDDSRTMIPHSFLLLQALPGIPLSAARLEPGDAAPMERELAGALLQLHSHRNPTFGDYGHQEGAGRWSAVFVPRLRELRWDVREMLSAQALGDLDAALALAEPALSAQGAAALVHGDVWAGNIVVRQEADGWHLSGLLDPVALQYADVEMELAYLQVFRTVGEVFFETYTASRPFRSGYEFRKLFYWLHTCMLHLWLGFGEAYGDRAVRVTTEILQRAPQAL